MSLASNLIQSLGTVEQQKELFLNKFKSVTRLEIDELLRVSRIVIEIGIKLTFVC